MDKEEKIEKLLKGSNITLLIISIVLLIVSIFIGRGSEDFVPTELCSAIIIYYSIVSILNKNNKTLIFKLGVMESIIMILFILFNRSLFLIVYFILGILYLIENIRYNIYLKNTKYKDSTKDKNNILMFLPYILGALILVVWFIYFVVNTRVIIKNSNTIKSQQDLKDIVTTEEKNINEAIVNSENAYKLGIKYNQDKIDTTKLISSKILKNNNYKCNAYTNITWEDSAEESYFNYVISFGGNENKNNAEYSKYHNVSLEKFYTGKTYISCNGKYEYKTTGY